MKVAEQLATAIKSPVEVHLTNSDGRFITCTSVQIIADDSFIMGVVLTQNGTETKCFVPWEQIRYFCEVEKEKEEGLAQ